MTTGASTGTVRNYLEWSRRGSATFVRYLLAYFLVIIVWQVGSQFGNAWMEDHPDASPFARLVVLVVPFFMGLATLPLATAKILHRPAWSFALPRSHARWADLGLGFGIGLVAVGAATLVTSPLTQISSVGWGNGTNLGTVVPFVLLALVGFLAQTSFEEGLYRGYSEQLVAKFTTKVWLILTLPAFLFASGHIGNVAAFADAPRVLQLLPYLLFGLTMAWAAYRAGSLLMAIGLHFANNLSLALVISTAGDVIPTIAPLQRLSPTLTVELLSSVVQAAVSILLVEWVVRRRVKADPSTAATPVDLAVPKDAPTPQS